MLQEHILDFFPHVLFKLVFKFNLEQVAVTASWWNLLGDLLTHLSPQEGLSQGPAVPTSLQTAGPFPGQDGWATGHLHSSGQGAASPEPPREPRTARLPHPEAEDLPLLRRAR